MTRSPPSLLDPDFVYVPSVETNIRKTFARIRREQRQAEERAQAVREEAAKVVTKIGRSAVRQFDK